MKGKLILIPVVIADETVSLTISEGVKEAVAGLQYFLCENVRTARRFVSSLKVHPRIEALNFVVLDKDTAPAALPELMAPLLQGHSMGVLSEAGCPGIADPGSDAVAYAHMHGITVIPLVGPSSILLALMGSGLNGQHFTFHGYLPVGTKEREARIRQLEQVSRQQGATQIFIETPYRNQALLDSLLRCLSSNTRLCVAVNLTAADEHIVSQPVGTWKKSPLALDKVPAVFLFQA